MSISPANKHSLPTLDKLGVPAPSKVDAEEVATQWLQTFEKYISSNDIDGVLSLLTEDAWWRDLLAMTWDFRSFQGQDQIRQFLTDRLADAELKNFKPTINNLESPYDDLTWIRVHLTFDSYTDWKAHSVFTNLESLNGHHEKIGPLRNFEPNHGKWLEQRKREMEYADHDPEVLIVGGGQSGLEVAARLKHTGISALVIEKQARIGDQWRHRYAALCLHDVVWYDHMPYIPFPESWPVYTPAQKLADWLESYARNMEIDYWTSATVTHARQEENGKWAVTVRRNDKDRVFHVDHVVFAIGVGGGTPNMPTIPGMKATDHAGKKVVVVGACTSAHDIAADYADHGVDVTLYQRSATYIMTTKEGMPRLMKGTYWEGGPPTNIADMIDNSMPILYRKMLHTRITKDIAEADHALLEGLKQRGFNLSSGVDDSGFLILALMRLGGYYLDVGASQMIIDGKIKLKSGSPIKNFTETGLEAEDGSNLPADVVLFATGYGDARNPIREIVGEELGKKLKPIWGLDEEGELRSVWRDSGLPNLWVMMGNFAWCRFYSKHLVLQIKAKREGIFDGQRYSLK
ncbi:hypothetical protein EW026_g8077 [Hermanssonia centrifuga]|uniref:Flavin-containing monooxygenase n=1 Tax=Hermanssonia centrifuga TaxID=98765 RepID=A0A4S4K5M0_9APHY|nr:hypothetical protein EW026_g8077 [Hermanssonia centrifuga]